MRRRVPWLAICLLSWMLGVCIGSHAILFVIAWGLHQEPDPFHAAAAYGLIWLIAGICLGEGRRASWGR